MKQKVTVGMIGLGTVGTGALRILRDNADLIRHRVGVPIEVTRIAVRDLTRDRGLNVPAAILAANRIVSIYGIINGTSNYILTKMTDDERSFADVLAEAQKAGYAEADPTFDVGGIDTAHKLAILVSLAFGTHIDLKHIFTDGI